MLTSCSRGRIRHTIQRFVSVLLLLVTISTATIQARAEEDQDRHKGPGFIGAAVFLMENQKEEEYKHKGMIGLALRVLEQKHELKNNKKMPIAGIALFLLQKGGGQSTTHD